MAARNMENIVEKVKNQRLIPDRYSFDANELERLLKMCGERDYNHLHKAIETAFVYGFAMGTRAARAGKVKNI